MSIKPLFYLILLCTLSSGCRLTNALVRTTIVEPLQYARNIEERCERGRFQELAELALAESEARARAELDNYSCDPFSADQKCGFIDGFVDYLDAGGTGSPPPLPPRRYWRAKYENPAGECAVQDWYHGYAHGAAAAQTSGLRQMVLVWPSDSIASSREPYYAGQKSLLDAVHETPPPAPADEDQPSRLVKQSKEPLPEFPVINPPQADQEGLAIHLPERPTTDSRSANVARMVEPLVVPENNQRKMPTTDLESAMAAKSAATPAITPAIETHPMAIDISNPTQSGEAMPAVTDSLNRTPSNESPGSYEIYETPLDNGTAPIPRFSRETLAPDKSIRPMVNEQPIPEVTPPRPERLPAPSVPPQSSIAKPPWRLPAVSRSEFIEPSAIPAFSPPETPVKVIIQDVVGLPSLGEQRHPESKQMSTPTFSPFTSTGDAVESLALRRLATSPTAARSDIGSQADDSSYMPSFEGESQNEKQREGSSPRGDINRTTTTVATDSSVRRLVRVAFVFLLTAVATVLAGWRWAQRPDPRTTGTHRPDRMSKKGRREGFANAVLRGSKAAALAMLISSLLTGCAALTNPVLNGIPARRLPPELLAGPRREGLQTIPLSLMRQEVPENYLLAAGDVLGVFIPGVFPLTLDDQTLPTPPVYFPSNVDPLGAGLAPSLGYPLTVRSDGTLALPLVDRISVEGLSVEEANDKIRDTFLEKGFLQPGRESVIVTLLQPRRIRILLFRQEVGGFAAGGRGDIATSNIKQGTSHVIDLRAYENDVLNALAYTGGLPGLDAFDGVYIFRGGQANAELQRRLGNRTCDEQLCVDDLNVETVHIPTRWPSCEPLPFEPSDVILRAGDVVLIEARSEDYFYTGGLLPAGEQRLPRDYDLDVVEAVSQVRGTLINGAFGGSNFTGRLIQEGVGNPNPSALTVIRRTPNGGQFPISVDLNRALRDPRERILVQAGDVLILQETAGEAITRYFNDIFSFSFAAQVIDRGSANGTLGVTQLR